jgi:hypothetical protein
MSLKDLGTPAVWAAVNPTLPALTSNASISSNALFRAKDGDYSLYAY